MAVGGPSVKPLVAAYCSRKSSPESCMVWDLVGSAAVAAGGKATTHTATTSAGKHVRATAAVTRGWRKRLSMGPPTSNDCTLRKPGPGAVGLESRPEQSAPVDPVLSTPVTSHPT